MNFNFTNWLSTTFIAIDDNNAHILSNINDIPSLYQNLNKDNQNTIIPFLLKNFTLVPFNIHIFSKVKVPSLPPGSNLIDVLINLYLSNDTINDDILSLISKCISTLGVTKTNLFTVYNSLSVNLFHQKKQINIKQYLTILSLLYLKPKSQNKPKNYFFFSSNGFINIEPKQVIKLKEGFAISLSFKPIVQTEFTIAMIKFENNETIIVKFTKDKYITVQDKVICGIEINDDDFINMSIIFKSKKKNIIEYSLILNDKYEFTNDIIFDTFPITSSVLSTISLFISFIGISTSVILTLLPIKNPNEHFKHLHSSYPFGIYKQSQYDSYSFSSFQTTSIFLPLHISQSSNLFMFSIISPPLNDVCNTKRLNLFQLGGISCLLPLIEAIDDNDVESFEIINEIIANVLIGNTANMKNASKSNFFECYSVLCVRLRENMFTMKVFESYKGMISELFALWDKIELCNKFFDCVIFNEKIFRKFEVNIQIMLWELISKCFESDISVMKNCEGMTMQRMLSIIKYYDNTINFDFCCEYHSKLLSVNDSSIINDNKVMSPSLSVKIKSLISLLSLILENDNEVRTNMICLINFLSCEMSPCLMSLLYEALSSYYLNEKISSETRSKTLSISIKNNLLPLSLFNISVAFPDVILNILHFYSSILKFKESVSDLNKFFKKNSSNVIYMRAMIYPNNKRVSINGEEEKEIDQSMPFKRSSFAMTPMKHNSVVHIEEGPMYITPEKTSNATTSNTTSKKFTLMKQNTLNAIRMSDIVHHSQLEVQYENEKKAHMKMQSILTLINEKEMKEITKKIIKEMIKMLINNDNRINNEIALDLIVYVLLYNEPDLVEKFFDVIISLISSENKYMKENISKISSNEQLYRYIIEIVFECYLTNTSKTSSHISSSLFTKGTSIITTLTLHSQSIDNLIDLFINITNGIMHRYPINHKDVLSFTSTILLDILMNQSFSNEGGFGAFISIASAILNRNVIDDSVDISMVHSVIKSLHSMSVIDFNSDIIEEFIVNNTKTDYFDNAVLSLINGTVPLSKLIIFSLRNDIDVNEISKFILLVIVSSSAINSSDIEYLKMQTISYDVILYGMKLLQKKNERELAKIIETMMKIVNENNIRIGKKKKKMKLLRMMTIHTKKKKNDLSKCAVVKIYTDYFDGISIDDKDYVSKISERVKQLKINDIIDRDLIEKMIIERNSKAKIFFESMKDENNNSEFDMKFYKIKNQISMIAQTSLAIIADDIKSLNYETEIRNEIFQHIYKKVQKNLFIFNRFYSNQSLFYPLPSIKYKIINHYTMHFSRQILAPILNLSQYIPSFSNFKKENLFIDNSVQCSNALPVISNTSSRENIIINTSLDINFATILYKSFSNDIYTSYLRIYNSETNHHTSSIQYNCCLLSQYRHYKGKIFISNNVLIFHSDLFLKESTQCLGSIFAMTHKKKHRSIPLSTIKFIFPRKYYYRNIAFEIFTTMNKSFYFIFTKEIDATTLMKSLCNFNSNIILIDDTFTNAIVDKWSNYKISNFAMIMTLNTIANRSFIDLSQYPVFPWIIAQYENNALSFEVTLNDYNDMRDLSSPMGMLSLNEKSKKRRENYINKYNTMKSEKTEEVFVYGSHYSNPMYTAHYLTRVFPFSFIMIELQGNKFDDPNRLFKSVPSSFMCAATQEADVRELIPEFYYMPEMFVNDNELNLGITTNENNVLLPPWSDNNPYEFVMKMRGYLENGYVNKNINKWIDMLFGYKQKGKEAENIFNVFVPSSYDTFNIDDVKGKDQQQYYYGLAEFGLTPRQLFAKEFPSRKKNDDKLVMDSARDNQLKYTSNKIKNQKKHLTMIILKVINNERVMGIFDNFTYTIYKFIQSSIDSKLHIDSSTKNLFSPSHQLSSLLYRYRRYPQACAIYSNAKTVLISGYDDNKIFQIDISSSSITVHSSEIDHSPIVLLSISEDDSFVLTGTSEGGAIIYSSQTWMTITYINDHINSPLTAISLELTLNIYADSNIDGYINIFTFPSCKMISSIKVECSVDFIFISQSPLSSIVVFSKDDMMFYVYSMNGFFLCKEEELDGVVSPMRIKDKAFCDYLVYGTEKGSIVIRAFPNMDLVGGVDVSDSAIKCIDVSEDRTHIYAWTDEGQEIISIKDPRVMSEADKILIWHMGNAFS